MRPIPQKHDGALLAGGVPGHKGANQYTDRQRAQVVRGQFLGQLEGIAADLAPLLSTARESDGDRGAPTAAVFTGVWRARRGMKG